MLYLFKKIVVFFITLVAGLFFLYLVVISFIPSFGGDLIPAQKIDFKQYKNFKKGKFINKKGVPEPLTLTKFFDLGYKFLTTKVRNGTPSSPVEIVKIDPSTLAHFEGTRLFWLGHSTFFVQHKGINILIDPMFGKVPAPIEFLGGKRFHSELPILPEELPSIDYVIYSHDHYDHLDYGSVIKLKDKVTYFITPLGLGNHLKHWGVEKNKIIEMNWWETKRFEELNFVCTPAQHFSGRKFSNSQETLWSSWVIKSDSLSLFFSGDSGYDSHFKEIGEKYGPFDLSLLECGQYNKMWPDVHMFPQETVQAGIDLSSKKIVPIHWGAFKLALHAWNEPAIIASREAREKKIPIEIPKIGQSFTIDSIPKNQEKWY